MQYRKLGNSGLNVSVAGLGCNNFGMRIDKEQTAAVVNGAIERGVTLFDTADIYGGTKSEEFLGAALGDRRKSVVVATKFAGPVAGDDPMKRGGSRRWVMQACEDSLRRLGTDYIDLYQYHFPDPTTPIEETLGALDDLVRQGKVRYIGNSNMTAWQVVEADWTARSGHLNRFVSAQNEYNLLDRRIEKELAPACKKYGLGMLPYFPLASGFLSGKYIRGEPPPDGTRLQAFGARGQAMLSDRNFDVLDKLTAFAEQRGKTVLDLAFAWLLGHDFVPSVIAGATTPEQVEANVAATEWRLTPEEMLEVDGMATWEKPE
jgi:aryl-alcohol dehydrogenase-like predicted oxidoreductase